MIALHGRRFCVSSSSTGSVVSAATMLTLEEIGPLICGRYGGGAVVAGFLVGARSGSGMRFRYVQGDESGTLDCGVSEAEIDEDAQGRVRLTEHYRWLTREGTGTNVFTEIIDVG